jgi:uncharacterized protein YeaO (DUF488 family)
LSERLDESKGVCPLFEDNAGEDERASGGGEKARARFSVSQSTVNDMRKTVIQIKRAYDPPSRKDGFRILVERLWPRGLTKAQVAADLWLKDVAPSPQLRKWFGHDPAKWKQFEQRYWKELQARTEPVDLIRQKMKEGAVTFVYAARDEEHNGALALKEFLERGKR